jgi:hypothetical protein
MNGTNVTLVGDGREASSIQLSTFYSGSQNGVTAGIFMNSANCEIRDMRISGYSHSAITNNAIMNGVERLAGSCRLRDVDLWYINGWAVETLNVNSSGSNVTNTHCDLFYVGGGYCAGGFKYDGSAGSTIGATIMHSGIGSTGTSSGANANLDSMLLNVAEDMIIMDFQGGQGNNAGTGALMHFKGCAPALVGFCDLGVGSSNPCILMEDASGGQHNQGIEFVNMKIVGAQRDVIISGGSNDIHFSNCKFDGASEDGVLVSSTGSNIYFSSCEWSVNAGVNGSGASGTNYDLNWSGTATGQVSDCVFGSSIVASGNSGVQGSVNITSNQNVVFNNVQFIGSGTSSSNWFTNKPAAAMVSGTSGFDFVSGLSATSIGAAQGFVPTAIKTSAYTAAPGDFIPVDTSGSSVTITLPTAPADKSRIEIKLINTSGTNTVTVNTGGSDVFNKNGGGNLGKSISAQPGNHAAVCC